MSPVGSDNRLTSHSLARCAEALEITLTNKRRNEPSLHMPTRWHFINLQNWQELRLNGVISHFWSLLQRWFIPCVKQRRKNPCKNTIHAVRRKATPRTFFGHAHKETFGEAAVLTAVAAEWGDLALLIVIAPVVHPLSNAPPEKPLGQKING